MKIRQVTAEGFASLESAELSFPLSGVCVVTGKNGAGKSSLFEIVAWAMWGETLRGTPPHVSGVPTRASVVSDVGVVSRTRTKSGKVTVSLTDAEAFESVTKAEEAIVTRAGTFEAWRKSHVFSSQDAAHFTLATDTERKTLIEELCGLSRFDAAYASARATVRKCEQVCASHESDLRVATVRVEEALKRVSHAKERETRERANKPKLDPAGEFPSAEKLEADVAAAKAQIVKLRDERRAQDLAGSAADHDRKSAQQRLSVLESSDSCPTCGQNTHRTECAETIAGLRASVAAAAEASGVARAESARLGKALQAAERALSELTELSARARASRAAHAEGEALWKSRVRQIVQEVEAAQDALTDTRAAVKRLEAGKIEAAHDLAFAEAVASVLSPKGVRAALLSDAIAGIETLADSYLQRLSDGMRLRMSSVTQNKNGSVRDAISIEVDGAGGGHGYKAASAGERRRIDVAILLALSEVSAGVHGGARGTLFFDEVFDSLDPDGVDRVEEILQDLAQDRCVVVITHSQEVQRKIRAVLRITVANGGVEV